MSEAKILPFLAQQHFLRDLAPPMLQNVADSLDRKRYGRGQAIVRQGAMTDGLYLVLEGKIELTYLDRQGKRHLRAVIAQGDTYGETELLQGGPWRNTLRASEDTEVLRWSLSSLQEFLKSHHDAHSRLKFAVQSRHLAQQLRFPWVREKETIHGLVRKHPICLVRSLLLPILLLCGAIALGLWPTADGGARPIVLVIGLAGIGLLLGIWRWIDWRNDFHILTDRRAIWMEKLVGIYDRRQEIPLHWVLSVSVSTGFWGRLFGYGNVVIRTYTGKLVFRDIGNPQAMAAMIEQHWLRLKEQRKQTDREEIIRELQQRLSKETTQEALPEGELPLVMEQGPLPEEALRRVGLGRWSFRMRFEEQGVITYRKHWAVLLRQMAAPSFLALVSLLLAGIRLAGIFKTIPVSYAIFGAIMLLLCSILWWLYRFVDWANDIYQISPTQIIDINKKPLAQEVRKVAPLENILGTEIDRKGILGLLLNYGSVVANVGTAQFVFQGVYDPAKIQQDIALAQESFLEHKAETERRQRREEVVEWLSAYHDEIAQTQKESEEEEQS
jgi:hypothetical protein